MRHKHGKPPSPMGQGRALERLWARLIPREMLSGRPLNSQQIESPIEDFSVSNEHIGESSYNFGVERALPSGGGTPPAAQSNVPYSSRLRPCCCCRSMQTPTE